MRSRRIGVQGGVDVHLALIGEVGLARSSSSSAARIRWPVEQSRLPNCECEQSAILGCRPKRRTWRAAPITFP
jgi:hypothetical protein